MRQLGRKPKYDKQENKAKLKGTQSGNAICLMLFHQKSVPIKVKTNAMVASKTNNTM